MGRVRVSDKNTQSFSCKIRLAQNETNNQNTFLETKF